MKIALVEPYVSVDSLKSYAEKAEPSHLIGMYNLLKHAGCDVELIDAYSLRLPVTELVNRLQIDKISHVGFSVYDYHPCLSYIKQAFDNLPENVLTLIGGPGATYCTKRMVQQLKPDFLVRGFGEQPIVDLVRSGFSSDRLKCEAFKIDNTFVVGAGAMPLDEIPFERPYTLGIYAYQASPRIQTGCIGNCVFCSGSYQKDFDYITEETAQRLFDYLTYRKQAKVLSPNGPDFTAIPHKANALIRVLLNGSFPFTAFRPGVRLDTLVRAIELDPRIWKRLACKYKISLESSIESFCLSRLTKLGKNISTSFFDNVLMHIRKILDTCNCTIVLGRIAIDPTISIDEFIKDCEGFGKLLHKFRSRVTIGGMLMNKFVPLFGTPAADEEHLRSLWFSDVFIDPAMVRLHDRLLSNQKFRNWCQMAEEISDFRERNIVFEEILRVASEQAQVVKSRG